MVPEDILKEFNRFRREIPKEALQAAEELRSELTPLLLEALSRAAEHPEELEKDPDFQLPFYAMYLLAAWREPRAYPRLLNFLRLPRERGVDLSGDIVTEDMSWMLAQTCAGDTAQLEALTIDRTVNEWARGAAVNALAFLTQIGEQTTESLYAQFRRIIAAVRQSSDPSLDQVPLGDLVCHVLDLQLVELRDEVLSLFDEQRIDEFFFNREDVLESLGNEAPMPARSPVTDVVKAISWWRCFSDEEDDDDDFEQDDDELDEWIAGGEIGNLPRGLKNVSAQPPLNLGAAFDPSPQPYRAPPKIGRNDPCPCGSGKKYKKCCGA